MMIRLLMTLALAAGLAAPAMAQAPGTTTNMEILRQKLKADKKLVIAENLGLTDAEGDRILARLRRVPEGAAADQPAHGDGDSGVCRGVQQRADHQRGREEAAG